MLGPLLNKLFGSKNDREVKRMTKIVKAVNALEESMVALHDDQLRAKTLAFKERIAQGESLDKLLPEAFAVVREASKRVMGMRHFDVQLIGSITLHEGKIAEMRTGEGKTLMCTLAVYLNALSGKGVHVVTVNDYLAKRDAQWMTPLYEFLGMTVGVIVPFQDPEEKRAAYNADITYGTNNEFGFDYLRDNMAFRLEDKFQRVLNFAVVDEVDSILIDEARTPLIISGQAEDSSELYMRLDKLIPNLSLQTEEGEGQDKKILKEGHYTIDEKARTAELTEAGHQYIEELLLENGLLAEGDNLYSSSNVTLFSHVLSALRAHVLYHRNVQYIIQDNEVLLIDENTGRPMKGRRLSEGLHQAIEAKERVPIQPESQTLASITFQNFFRLYSKLSGMTGTADTEAFEFRQIYNLDVVVIPTNRPLARKDSNDLVYMTKAEKYRAISDEVKAARERKQPVLVGTASIEASEILSNELQKQGIKHSVLNAKFHDKEADIIAQAGRPGAVTIATNMAGRGTDILLGGNWEAEAAKLEEPTAEQLQALEDQWRADHQTVLDAGGLFVIGTERHESRRIDNQLRGRSGRQGDPGASRFYLSLEDDLMRIFASDRMRGIMQMLGMKEGEAIEHRMVTNAIEKAQRKVEGRNFDIRKQLLEYDDVANEQRKVIYHMRDTILETNDISHIVTEFRNEVLTSIFNDYIPPMSLPEQWDIEGLEQVLRSDFGQDLPIQQWLDEDDKLYEETLKERITQLVTDKYAAVEADAGNDNIRGFEKYVLLREIDDLWKDHLTRMDNLRQGIHLRGYAQKNPKQEYKRESFEMFERLLGLIKYNTISILANAQVNHQTPEEEEAKLREEAERLAQSMVFQHDEAVSSLDEDPEQVAVDELAPPAPQQPIRREGDKVGRNDPCPCGSGKKYKHCCGRIE
ncbi:preprotein translocase subunit SecA [Entomomonas moraniae]|uniref:Protein translocase subunit SecA n=1 Tax=Entomomonas moraniae TaxID=2213226 RepID=A0A3Q9JHR5_9GAMM|nr:preprotein translocase subunit SecA [Entomomonas moraniae]AZS49910.1 preprotein translocase subunit SecA [Entomomonas moraniae]